MKCSQMFVVIFLTIGLLLNLINSSRNHPILSALCCACMLIAIIACIAHLMIAKKQNQLRRNMGQFLSLIFYCLGFLFRTLSFQTCNLILLYVACLCMLIALVVGIIDLIKIVKKQGNRG